MSDLEDFVKINIPPEIHSTFTRIGTFANRLNEMKTPEEIFREIYGNDIKKLEEDFRIFNNPQHQQIFGFNPSQTEIILYLMANRLMSGTVNISIEAIREIEEKYYRPNPEKYLRARQGIMESTAIYQAFLSKKAEWKKKYDGSNFEFKKIQNAIFALQKELQGISDNVNIFPGTKPLTNETLQDLLNLIDQLLIQIKGGIGNKIKKALGIVFRTQKTPESDPETILSDARTRLTVIQGILEKLQAELKTEKDKTKTALQQARALILQTGDPRYIQASTPDQVRMKEHLQTHYGGIWQIALPNLERNYRDVEQATIGI